jgi:tetratricopeptide (TPR) repeat protein
MKKDLRAAHEAHQAGDLARAANAYRRILARDRDNFEALHQLAIVMCQQGDAAEGERLFQAALSVQPNDAAAWYNLGQSKLPKRDFQSALACFERAIQLDAKRAEALNALGFCLLQLGRAADALPALKHARDLDPTNPDPYSNLGDALLAVGDNAAALAVLAEGIRRCPTNVPLNFRYAMNLLAAGALQESIARLDLVLAAAPRLVDAHVARGVALQRLGDAPAALASYQRAVDLDPAAPAAYSNIAVLLNDVGRSAEALEWVDKAIALQPGYAEAHSNKGNVLKSLGNLEAAIGSYAKAAELAPNFAQSHVNLAVALLTVGRHREGWREYEWRWRLDDPRIRRPGYDLPVWTGEAPLAGKRLLVWWEQGFGDTLQFAATVAGLRKHGCRVVLEAQPTLAAFLSRNKVADAVIDTVRELGEFDYQIPILSLPAALGHDRQDIVAPAHPFTADPSLIEAWSERLGPRKKPRVGVVWSGNPNRDADADRSIRLAEFLACLPDNVEAISLQKDLSDADRSVLAKSASIAHFGAFLTDFSQTAALCANVDLVVAVDTSAAHLAALLGKETWLLLEKVPAWRWLLDREDTPWYPSVRLVRQTKSNDWSDVLSRVKTKLRACV